MHKQMLAQDPAIVRPSHTSRYERVVVKVGSRLLTGGSDVLDRARMLELARVVATRAEGSAVIVSSGAVAAGYGALGYSRPPERASDRQAAAAVGQGRLMSMWSEVFALHGRQVAQVLLTNDCLTDRTRYVAARSALAALLRAGVIPIVNENDTVSVGEIVVGDNDNLAAMTASLVDAELLVLLTDVPGVLSADPSVDPGARLVRVARSADELKRLCFGKKAAESTGGMATKLEAASRAGRYGIPTVIASGTEPDVLRTLLDGGARGTRIEADPEPLSARRHWMAVQRGLNGYVVVDEGAVMALRRRASLLPSGVIGVGGRFRRGDLVSVLDSEGRECARGIVRFSDRQLETIRGLHTTEARQRLGEEGAQVVMRPDRIVLSEEESVVKSSYHEDSAPPARATLLRPEESRDLTTLLETMGRTARRTALRIARSSAEDRRDALLAIAQALVEDADEVAEANKVDLAAADARGISGPMRDRLVLDRPSVIGLADSVRDIAAQPDILGTVEEEHTRPNGLRVGRMRIPLGVIAMIYESRPNVTVDAAVLSLKAGNSIILRGGSEAIHTNTALVSAIRRGLEGSPLAADAVQLVPVVDREAVDALLQLESYVDLVIPRGGEGLIRAVTEKSRIPVLQHYKGVCHVFLDESASEERAIPIVVNAKVQRPGVCNAMETLLVHEEAAPRLLPGIAAHLLDHGVELRGCVETRRILSTVPVTPATDADWGEEYLDLKLAIRVVPNMEAALTHIADFGSSHTEAIVTDDEANAEAFVSAVQSSTVLVNASTRFADGGELGLGAEIGISTSKLHAFGPMGANELTTRKFVVFGEGQTR